MQKINFELEKGSRDCNKQATSNAARPVRNTELCNYNAPARNW